MNILLIIMVPLDADGIDEEVFPELLVVVYGGVVVDFRRLLVAVDAVEFVVPLFVQVL
jgi:hypothetical protein